MDQHTTDVIDALNALELGLRDLGLWSDVRPDPEALASTMPFCYDTLELEQWLQKIPDDPGGLLRRKFNYQRQVNEQQGQYLENNEEGQLW